MSASAPAGRPTRKSGRLAMVVNSATGTGEVVSVVISQAAATPCIKVPMLEARAAIQMARKTGRPRGPQADVARVRAWAVGNLQRLIQHHSRGHSSTSATAPGAGVRILHNSGHGL